ncbi:hypothetical protein PLICRDRAFT_496569 [Plicaturopsis crispa FD-325 SS-3]|nr:hypothetical protein PLICRDRAFT_496569 [Plicaturopsis crispa FD-325 SS-3]
MRPSAYAVVHSPTHPILAGQQAWEYEEPHSIEIAYVRAIFARTGACSASPCPNCMASRIGNELHADAQCHDNLSLTLSTVAHSGTGPEKSPYPVKLDMIAFAI